MLFQKEIQKISKEFSLRYIGRQYPYLLSSKRLLIMRNVLGGCPDPRYIKCGNAQYKNRPMALMKYLFSKYFKKELKGQHGCVISRKELNQERNLLPYIPHKDIQKEMTIFYNQVKKEMGKNKRIIVVWTPSQKERNHFKEVLLHEFTHELIDDNRLRPNSWKWNEGLVTYITRHNLGTHHVFEKAQIKGKDKMWSIYSVYTHKWAKIFKQTYTPQEKYTAIVHTLKKINTPKKG